MISFDDIIPPVDRALLESELNQDRFVRTTNKGGNEIYIINHHNAPNSMREIGRLREMAFRMAGGGTGMPYDIDEADTDPVHYYEQLIVYNRQDKEIVGGYRFILGEKSYDQIKKKFHLSTAHYFDFSSKMMEDYLPYSIELGRSWVQPAYQPSVNARKGLFSLMNIWDGLGGLVTQYPSCKYFFGKVTLYPHYNRQARNLLLSFMEFYFPSRPDLCEPKPELLATFDTKEFDQKFDKTLPFKDGIKVLSKMLRAYGEQIPPLFNIYMNLSTSMMTFGTATNPDFGSVEETGLLIEIEHIEPRVKERHIHY